jgi:AraC-like DNA-binding protein
VESELKPRISPALAQGGDIASALACESSDIDGIFPVLPYSRRDVQAHNVRNLVESQYGSGGRRVTGSHEMRMMVSDFSLRRNAVSPATGQGYLKFHYKLSGKNVVRFANSPEMLIESGRSAMVFHPVGLTKDDCFPADVRELSVTIGCQRETVLDLLGVSVDELPKRARRYFNCADTDFCGDGLALNSQMIEALYSLIKPSFAPWLQKLHVESKMLDLICLSLHELARQDFQVESLGVLRPRDVDMLQAVRQYLEVNIGNGVTIQSLCAKFATNRAKLSAGYKALFGETIFEYLHRLRMDHAMALISQTEMSMSDIAEKVGYSHQSSFSTAFREHHGVSPLCARRK